MVCGLKRFGTVLNHQIMDHTMKISTLLLSSAAVLVAGAAYAADLPAKKAAPAAVTGCTAFGAGFFAIPGGDNCIKFSGRVTADTKAADAKGSRTSSTIGFGAGFRLNVDARSNTDAGALRSYGRLDSGSLSYAYLTLGGLTAGLADSSFDAYDGAWNWNADGFDNGNVNKQLSYTAALGGASSLTFGIEDPTNQNNSSVVTHVYNTKDTATETVQGAAQYPDMVGNFKTSAGAASIQVSGALHNNHGLTAGDKTGFAMQAYGKFSVAAGTEFHAQASYADAATAYLGYTNAMADYANAQVTQTAKGYALLGAVNQAVGAGSVSLSGRYAVITPAAASPVDTKITQVELSYDYTGVKGFQVVPMVYLKNVDDGTTATQSTSGLLRIERDF